MHALGIAFRRKSLAQRFDCNPGSLDTYLKAPADPVRGRTLILYFDSEAALEDYRARTIAPPHCREVLP